jgi:hypothetical protein
MPVRAKASSRRGRNGRGRPRGLGRDDILVAIAKVFARRGYHGTDMEPRGPRGRQAQLGRSGLELLRLELAVARQGDHQAVARSSA